MAIVRVEKNSIPIRPYMFYLTHTDRSKKSSFMKGIELNSDSIYKQSIEWRKQHNEKPRKSNVDKIEIVFSMSIDKNRQIKEQFFNGDINKWELEHKSKVEEIMRKVLKNCSFLIYSHQRDKNNERVHCHVLVFPYKEVIENQTKERINIKMDLIDKEKLIILKKLYNSFEKSYKVEKEGELKEGFQLDKIKELRKPIPLPKENKSIILSKNTFRSKKEKEILFEMLENVRQSKKIELKKDTYYSFLLLLDYIKISGDKEILQIIEQNANFVDKLKVTNKYTKYILVELVSIVSSIYIREKIMFLLNSKKSLYEERDICGIYSNKTRINTQLQVQTKGL